jgi:hypothetical protein
VAQQIFSSFFFCSTASDPFSFFFPLRLSCLKLSHVEQMKAKKSIGLGFLWRYDNINFVLFSAHL